jgi:uncharacterized protein (TIGR04255 family)
LVLVLAQVRFSAVLAIDKYVPSFQERLRVEGFPRFQQEQVRSIELALGNVTQREMTRWHFRDRNASSAVTLTTEFLALQTNRYESFDKFLKMTRLATDAFVRDARPSLVERVGLRYVNLIRPNEGEGFTKYLRPGLLGLREEDLGIEPQIHRFEMVGRTPTGSLLVTRLAVSQDGTFLPPDLSDNPLDYAIDLPAEEVVAVLDIDHFDISPFDFDPSAIEERLWGLHDQIDLVFRSAVTEDALRSWKGGDAG